MRRIVQRLLPDGSIRRVQPFHCHVGVLAASQREADSFGAEVKRMYSMWFSQRYSKSEILKEADIKAIALDSDWYVRNALAYIPRNALDNGCNVNTYPWSGYQAMFGGDSEELSKGRLVCMLSKRECRAIFHTGDSLKDVSWLVDSCGHLIPSSFCDTSYLEQVFEGEQAYFLKTIGCLNSAEMQSKLVEQPRRRFTDSEFFKLVNEVSLRYYKTDISKISITQKYRLLPYIQRTMHTTVPQLARTFGMTRGQVSAALGARSPKSPETLPSEMAAKGIEGQ